MDDDRYAVWTFERYGETVAEGRPDVSDEERAAAGRETLTERRRALVEVNRRIAAQRRRLPADREIVRVWSPRDPGELRRRLGANRLALWAEGEVLHVLWSGEADGVILGGGVQPRLWPVEGAEHLWEASLRIRRLDEAVISMFVMAEVGGGEPVQVDEGRWHGPRAPEQVPAVDVLKGTIERYDLPFLGEPRGITVYRPPNAEGPLPTCLVTDGWSVAVHAFTVEAAILAGALPPVLLVGVDNARPEGGWPDPRSREYLPEADPARFAAHLEFVTGTVVPWARRTVHASPPWTAVGCSNGADWALAAAAHAPEVFRRVVALSPGSLPTPSGGGVPARCYVAAGTLEGAFRDSARRWAGRLRDAGAEVGHEEWVGGHDDYWWSQRLPAALARVLA